MATQKHPAVDFYEFELHGVTARGYPDFADGVVKTRQPFVVLKGSQAFAKRSAVRRAAPLLDRDESDRLALIKRGVLVSTSKSDIMEFAIDWEFTSASKAAGVIIASNCSGAEKWFSERTRESLADLLRAEG